MAIMELCQKQFVLQRSSYSPTLMELPSTERNFNWGFETRIFSYMSLQYNKKTQWPSRSFEVFFFFFKYHSNQHRHQMPSQIWLCPWNLSGIRFWQVWRLKRRVKFVCIVVALTVHCRLFVVQKNKRVRAASKVGLAGWGGGGEEGITRRPENQRVGEWDTAPLKCRKVKKKSLGHKILQRKSAAL